MATRQQNARDFVKTWEAKEGREDAERQTFINDLLQRICGLENYMDYITYEKDVRVKDDKTGKVTTRRIDGYIPSTKVMIEMKGKEKDLTKPLVQSGGEMLTPFQQAERYARFLPANEKPSWIVVSNFKEIDIHDMNKPLDPPSIIKLEDLPTKFKALDFLVDKHEQQIINEQELSVSAGALVAKIYEELRAAYALKMDPNDKKIQKSLNILIVRLVFLLYADDTGILGEVNKFQNYIESFKPRDINSALRTLFKVLDLPKGKPREELYLSKELESFAYVNGGMFADETIIIPQFTPELKNLIVNQAGKGFNWANISPTIFGAVFESTLNPDTRRKGGMHYTSIENIHKVIGPLFLDDLQAELEKIANDSRKNKRVSRAKEFQQKIGKLKFFDPACGSGNFLTETYLQLRHMENECLRIIYGKDSIGDTGLANTSLVMDTLDDPIKVKIQNFYGIEINDFAVSVARTAMWIAENQMLEETNNTIYGNHDFLPLDSNDSIYEGNALHVDWNTIVKNYELNYIMGNPPFVGYHLQSKQQKEDLVSLVPNIKRTGILDYVTGWYFKAAKYMEGSTIHCAFVSTNSISQGEQVNVMWPEIFRHNMEITFAYPTFIWGNEASDMAHVHVVIVGFADKKNIVKDKKIIYENGVKIVANISPYLIEGRNISVTSRSKPLSKVPELKNGTKTTDGGHLLLSKEEKDELVKKEPLVSKFIRPFIGARELISGNSRYCLWLVDATPKELRSMKLVMERVNQVKQMRLESKKDATQKLAETPQLFGEIRETKTNYLAIPSTSSKNREYVPMGYESPNTVASNAVLVLDATKYELGVLESSAHMAWMRTVAGRLKSDYRYSAKVVYNNFPWPEASEGAKAKVTKTAQEILNARALYPDSSLADLYDPLTMPIELRKAHKANDRAVLKLYGLKPSTSESDIVKHLFDMYEKIISKNG